MDEQTKGAWLLAQSKCLDGVNGGGRLENIQYAGKTGRLYNLLRRNTIDASDSTLQAQDITRICQLNNIDRAAREYGLLALQREGRIDITPAKAVAVIGATTTAVLEATSSIFENCDPTNEERAAIYLSERVSENPLPLDEANKLISDMFSLTTAKTKGVLDLCKSTAIVDQAEDKGFAILFNNNNFRNAEYAQKAFRMMQALSVTDMQNVQEVLALIKKRGAIVDTEAAKILSESLYKRVIGIGLFDRLEVSNNTEAIGYLTSPNSFQKFGRPFEDDPIDDAKALLASLTYGMTRSAASRGHISFPDALIRKLISGEEIGGKYGATAIGEDYRELEKRQVVQVFKKNGSRFTMKLLKKDVGELARTIISGNAGAQEALLMDGAAAQNFKGPSDTRADIRAKHTLNDTQFILGALDQMRSEA
ncbi:hypothetical protein [Pseudomonas sp. St316]|uniref:hypothetical protein n=1 Tax=Pseudomonas sp. St316 TaxID=2678257 RepID=UPI001BB3F318|nr:hypothetical protein [Pseudomonas sp. St316]BBP61401.1 hypothetical protein PHLH4_49910 [Pseudomonas sp. St316]